MSGHVTGYKGTNRYDCCSVNTTSIVLNRDYFTGSFREILATVKYDPTATTFELKPVCFFKAFVYRYTETIRAFAFVTLQSVSSLNAKFKKNNCIRGCLCLIGVNLRT